MKFSKIILEKNDHIAKITLNRPESSNALDEEMIEELTSALTDLDIDNNIRCILLTGAGKHFCAGGDVKKMLNKEGMFAGEPNELRERYKRGIQQIPLTFERLSTPVVAVVNGAAIGAGLDLACMCDIRVSSTRAKFGETFAKLGLIPGDGGTWFLQRVVGYSKAVEMTLTANIYDSEEALKMNLVSYVGEDFEDKALELATQISSNAPIAVQMAKRSIQHARNSSLQEALDLLAAYQGISQRTEDHFEGLQSLVQKSQSKFKHK
ncbi:MAG: 3-hxdroxyacyl-CoA dehydrogenase [Halobacteriovoraceae bacterium]|nr:3-hxdroxyacyl-CoA dehydrogenase [Halobacteriovoraceae bacterium]|tara:strand:+ start:8283 stop:9077 length:795 start_codon:yes stop_codon:yes gene_type:complete